MVRNGRRLTELLVLTVEQIDAGGVFGELGHAEAEVVGEHVDAEIAEAGVFHLDDEGLAGFVVARDEFAGEGAAAEAEVAVDGEAATAVGGEEVTPSVAVDDGGCL